MPLYNLYALAKGESRDYMESLLLTERSLDDCARIKSIAAKDGFHTFRVARVDNIGAPDFVAAISKDILP